MTKTLRVCQEVGGNTLVEKTRPKSLVVRGFEEVRGVGGPQVEGRSRSKGLRDGRTKEEI